MTQAVLAEPSSFLCFVPMRMNINAENDDLFSNDIISSLIAIYIVSGRFCVNIDPFCIVNSGATWICVANFPYKYETKLIFKIVI